MTKPILVSLSAALLLLACNLPPSPPSMAPTASPSASPSTLPTSSPTASPSGPAPEVTPHPDGPVAFAAFQGYQVKAGQQIADPMARGTDSSIEGFKVIRTQVEFDTYLEPQTGVGISPPPDQIDFNQDWLLITAKQTWAYQYSAEVTGMRMQAGDLLVDYRYRVFYSPDHMLNDFLRPEYTFTRFAQVNYQELKFLIEADAEPSASASATASSN